MTKYVLYTKYVGNDTVSITIEKEELSKNKPMFPKSKDWIVECFDTELDALNEKQETINFINFIGGLSITQ